MTRSDGVFEVEIADLEHTHQVAAQLAMAAHNGCVIGLQGDLGAGKTAFAAGFVAALPGGERARVSSPTWAVMQEYPTAPRVRHLDLYRLEGADDLEGVGLEGLKQGVLLVEWPDRVPEMLDLLDVLVVLHTGPAGPLSEARHLRFEGRTAPGCKVVQELAERLGAA